jgi:hypothetical protein
LNLDQLVRFGRQERRGECRDAGHNRKATPGTLARQNPWTPQICEIMISAISVFSDVLLEFAAQGTLARLWFAWRVLQVFPAAHGMGMTATPSGRRPGTPDT